MLGCYDRNKYKLAITEISYLRENVTNGVCHVGDDVSQCFVLGHCDL